MSSSFAPGRRKAHRWGAAIAAAVAVAGGGAVAGYEMTNSAPASNGQGAVLSAALGDASAAPSAGAAAGHPGVRARAVVRHLRGIHGEFTVAVRGGGFRQIAFERGTITAVTAKNVTVRAPDGTTWTWTLMGNTAVVKNRAKTAASSLATGDRVFVGGPESGSARDARLILVPVKQQAGRGGGRSSAPAS